MKRWASRLFEAVLTLWLLATLCFVLLRAAPGGPFDTEKAAPPEVQAALAAQYRLDRPLPAQYAAWLGDVVRGDLGPSFQYPDYRVTQLIASALPVSMLNGGLALLLALILGIPLGTWAALRAGRWTDRVLMFAAGLGLAIPKFVAAPLLVLLFAVSLHWLPAGGWGGWSHVVLPVIALALPNIAYCARLTRASLLETLSADYLKAARARGLSETRLLLAHAMKPALLPVAAWLSPALINVVTGSAVVEQVFGIPGMGRYFVQGALNRDYTLVLGVVLVVGALIVAINALVDALRAAMDPRLAETN
ncbi:MULTISPECIES: ABC transporter permease subunit [unclassified Lysobacter]|uniref:ABC transporter permease subunit n=1 Tax=unclassified Lysobacter TaxID=2635362 RepID=UPI000700B80B|nr:MULTISPECIES: ABC transporter permease subunit [unclassified Lysobacter]KRA16404.1 oligopeptide transporter permease [Lysobacter sp. Root604]KRD32102.1 oligopeptide transporter permease [Lysobacter sp. Root916]KRD75976.1 oligopeptide transporter permease [Lysobacter sp. Root983]